MRENVCSISYLLQNMTPMKLEGLIDAIIFNFKAQKTKGSEGSL